MRRVLVGVAAVLLALAAGAVLLTVYSSGQQRRSEREARNPQAPALTAAVQRFGVELLLTEARDTAANIVASPPRFTMEYPVAHLKRHLRAMGLRLAFDPSRADLSGTLEAGGTWLEQILHRARIEVSEEGVEAQAATAGKGIAGGRPDLLEVAADRPFLFILTDGYRTPLFMAVVRDPR